MLATWLYPRPGENEEVLLIGSTDPLNDPVIAIAGSFFLAPMFSKKLLLRIWLGLLLLAPVVLWLLPAGLFDHSDVVICPSRFLFDVECLGCGMTRAVMHMHHFEWREAVYYNYGVLAVYPGLIVVWLIWLRQAWRAIQADPSEPLSSRENQD